MANAVLPTFAPLSDEDLLHGGSQNQDEAINVLIRQHATKETNPGLAAEELTTFLAVSYFNYGSTSISLVLQELGINQGLHCIKASKKLDCNMLHHSCHKGTQGATRR